MFLLMVDVLTTPVSHFGVCRLPKEESVAGEARRNMMLPSPIGWCSHQPRPHQPRRTANKLTPNVFFYSTQNFPEGGNMQTGIMPN